MYVQVQSQLPWLLPWLLCCFVSSDGQCPAVILKRCSHMHDYDVTLELGRQPSESRQIVWQWSGASMWVTM